MQLPSRVEQWLDWQKAKAQKQVPLFDHLPQYERVSSLSLNIGFSSREWLHIHPAVVRLGLHSGLGAPTKAAAEQEEEAIDTECAELADCD